MTVARFRVARPASSLEGMRAFYVDGLGLVDNGAFLGHAGYDGHLYATADGSWEIEFTWHADDVVAPPASPNSLLVFYFDDPAEIAAIGARLAARGITPVSPANPYWIGKGVTYVDPDGWRVVLFDKTAR